MIESKTPITDSIRARRMVVPVDAISPDTRLAFLLPEIDSISSRVAQEQEVKEYAANAIREALTYQPSFAIEIRQALVKSAQILWEKGYQPKPDEDNDKGEAKNLDQVIADKMRTFDLSPRVNSYARKGVVKSVIRQIARLVHPDSNDDLAIQATDEILSDEERKRALAKASAISKLPEHEQAEEAQRLKLETMPITYLRMVRSLQAQGKSLEEIVATYPQLVPEMEELRYTALLRLPKPDAYRRFKTREDADKEAAMMKRKPEHHARTMACGYISSLYSQVADYSQGRSLTPELEHEFKEIGDFMKRAFGYVGGTGEFVVQHGNRLISDRAVPLIQRLEDFIRVLPEKLFILTEVATADELDGIVLKQALDGVRYAVDSVNMNARRYGQELEDEANGRRREPDYGFLDRSLKDSLLSKDLIYKEEKIIKKNFY